MNHKILFAATALILMSGSAFAQTSTCPDGMTTGSCNITEIGDRDYDGSQTVGDTINPTYSPDSASASASTGSIDVDSVGQGGTASATGNTSTNNNASNANNSATNNMTNGAITNDVTGGTNTQTQGQGQSIGDATQTATTTSGPATTNSGSIQTSGGASTSRATGGAGGRATGGSSNSGGNVMRGGNTNIDASQRTTIKHAANTAAMSNMQAYGPGNCFGDTNPSGGFQASVQTFGWGVAASSHKASNVCAINQVMGSGAAAQYLMKMDPNAGEFMQNNPVYRLPDGTVLISKEEVKRRKAEQAQLEKEEAAAVRRAQRAAPTSTKTLVCPAGFALVDRGDKMVCRQGVAPVVAQRPAASTPKCPAGSKWDGRGCYAPNLKAVRK